MPKRLDIKKIMVIGSGKITGIVDARTATKEEMCEAFSRKGPNDAFRELVSTAAAKDYKPMDDIVDAFFMTYFVAENCLWQLS